jgi:hypothetical protein
MNHQTFWQRLSVQDFFGNSNWEGRWLAAEGDLFDSDSAVDVPDEPTSLLCLNLKDFIDRSNWEGKPHVRPTRNRTQQARKVISLTLSVGEFFQLSAWEGQQGTVPLSTSKPIPAANPISSRDRHIQVQNLSNLF